MSDFVRVFFLDKDRISFNICTVKAESGKRKAKGTKVNKCAMTLKEKVLESFLSEEIQSAESIIKEYGISEIQFWDIVMEWTSANVWSVYGE
jgi:hypothetical protein